MPHFAATINYQSPNGRPCTRRFQGLVAENEGDAFDAAAGRVLKMRPGARIDGGDVVPTPPMWKVTATPSEKNPHFLYIEENTKQGRLLAQVFFADRERASEGDFAVARILGASRDLLAALVVAEDFMAGFEDDEAQEGMNEKLAQVRAALAKAGV